MRRRQQKGLPLRRLAFVFALCAAVLVALSGTAVADTTLTFTGVNGASQGGYYVSPYTATVNGVPTMIFCDDFVHEVTWNETWTAYVSSFDSLTHVRFKDDDTLQDYDEAAFLIEQSLSHPSEYGNVQYAIWAIFNPTQAEGSSGFITSGTDSSSYWLSLAESQHFHPGEFSNWRVYTPKDSGEGSPQEMLGPTPAPEPGTLLLLGTGMVGLIRKRRKQ